MNITLLNWDDEDAVMFEVKGYLPGLSVDIDGIRFMFDFYDPVRFHQTIVDETNMYGFYYDETPTVIIPSVTKENILSFLSKANFKRVKDIQ